VKGIIKVKGNKMKYNLGSGNCPIEGYENLDIKNGQTAYPLGIPDGSADEIRASHLLEHFKMSDTFNVVQHWSSKLKQGGVLKIAVPNFDSIVDMYKQGTDNRIGAYLMGGQTDDNDYHKSIFNKAVLTEIMTMAGLGDIKEWSDIKDCSSLPVSLNLCGVKKNGGTVSRKISAVISMPRVGFADTMNCMMQEIVARGIPVQKGSGVYWSQVLTRMMQRVAFGDDDYLLTLDYDSWFRFEHIQRLLSIMERNPDLDAVFPIQVKRECENLLMGVTDEKGKVREHIPFSEFEKDYIPAKTGHFGLTVFRCSALRKLKKPWFLGIPNADGEWEENRIDDDIYFWHNFYDCGLKAGVAPSVSIGHLQLVCTFPGTPDDGFKPVHCAINDITDAAKFENIPEHCRC
jgi:hypothetical protein